MTNLSNNGFAGGNVFVDNSWLPAQSTSTFEVVEPATEESFASIALANKADVDAAVTAARRALVHGEWPHATQSDRAKLLQRFGSALREQADQTSPLVSRENGMPVTLSDAVNGYAPAMVADLYADIVEGFTFEEHRPNDSSTTIVTREPVGVVAAIVPWNFPQVLALMKLAPALAAGCTVVLKPSPETSLDAAAIAEAAVRAGLPPGVVNIVPADREVGAYLVSHAGIDKVAFTGSTAAGESIAEACGRLVRPVTLELGGKSASIILEDADLDLFYDGLGNTGFQNNGQTCITQSRILAPRSRYDEVIETTARFARNLVVGDPLDRTTTCGPMASRTHRERVLGYIERARADGARLVTGGGSPRDLTRGWFVEPTVFADVDNKSELAQEEVFGPVLAIIPYDNEDEAIVLANDSIYGLAGSVWTADRAHGLEIARRVRTGTIGVNHYNMDLSAPFGGMKRSGLGREAGPEGMDAYLEYKSIYTVA